MLISKAQTSKQKQVKLESNILWPALIRQNKKKKRKRTHSIIKQTLIKVTITPVTNELVCG